MNARRSQRLFDPLFTTERMREIFSDHGRVQSMLDFECLLDPRSYLGLAKQLIERALAARSGSR